MSTAVGMAARDGAADAGITTKFMQDPRRPHAVAKPEKNKGIENVKNANGQGSVQKRHQRRGESYGT
jgi:hypothetical protein